MSDNRIYNSKIDINEHDAQIFWKSRATKYDEKNPFVCVNFGDSDPEKAKTWDVYERETIIPLLEISKQSSVLDIGCGIGRTAEAILSDCGYYLGIDYSAEFIEIAKQRVPAGNFLNMPIQGIGTLTQKFNLFIFNGVLAFCNDKTIMETFQNLPSISQDKSMIYINNSVAINDRLTLKNFYSAELKSQYNSIYRTEQENFELFKPLFEANFELKQQGDFKIETAGEETKRMFHIFTRI